MKTPARALTLSLVLLAALGLSVAGCESKTEEKAEKTAEKTTEAGTGATTEPTGDETAAGGGDEAAAAEGSVDIPALGLQTTAPAGTTVSEMLGAQMLQGPGLVASIEAASDTTPAGAAAAKAEATDMYSAENIQDLSPPDGWGITWENTGGAGKNYWVQVRREINGNSYWCSTTATTPEQQANAVTACTGLKAK